MFLGFGKKISQVVANQSKSSNLLRQPKNIQQILRLLTTYLNHKYSTFEQEQKTELVSDYDFIVSRIEENPNQEQDLVRQENYEIIFPEDSKEIPYNDVRYMHNYMNKVIEYVTVEEHLEDLLFYMREDIAQQNSQNKSNQHSNSTNTDQTSSSTQKQQQENHHKNEAHFTPRYQGKTAEERKVVFFNTNSKKIAKNCTPQLINQLIQATELFYTLPNALKGIYKRKFTQMYKMIFYNDISMSIPLPQMRKILFFAVCHNIQLNNIIAVRYFAHHKLSDIFEVPTQEFYPILSNNNNSDHIKDKEEPTDNNINDIEKKLFKLSKTNENELKFDNLIDLIIYIYILKDKTIRISNAYIHENALQNIESIMKAIKSKQFQFKFKSFLMLYSQLVQLYAEQPEQQRIENKRLKTIIEETSQIIFLILHQVQFAEQKLEILLLFTLAQEKEKVDFYLPVVQDHIKQNIDNLNLSDEFLRIICNHISFLKSTHELSYNYFMNILFEQPTLSNSCVTAILKSDNNIALDLPFKLKKKMLQVVDSDSVNAKSMSSFFTTPFSVKINQLIYQRKREFSFCIKLIKQFLMFKQQIINFKFILIDQSDQIQQSKKVLSPINLKRKNV